MEGTEPRRKRTRGRAGKTDPVPDRIALITDPAYRHAMSAIRDGMAFVLPSAVADRLQPPTGEPIANGFRFTPEDFSPEEIKAMDPTMLLMIYGTVLARLRAELDDAIDPDEAMRVLEDPGYARPVRLFLPELLERIGSKSNPGELGFEAARSRIKALSGLAGILSAGGRPGAPYERLDVVADFSEDEETSTLTFSSPYCEHVTRALLKKHLRRDADGELELSPEYLPVLDDPHNYVLRATLATERSKSAAEIVLYTARLAAVNGPRATTAQGIINECPILRHRLTAMESTSDKNKIIKRAFSTAWNILDGSALHVSKEKGRSPWAAMAIPTLSALDKTKFVFPALK